MRLRTTEDFGALARERRRHLGLSQAQLADRAHVTRQWVVRFESGGSDASLAKVLAVLRALDLDLKLDLRDDIGSSDDGSPHPSAQKYDIPRIERPQMDLSRVTRDAVARAQQPGMPGDG